MGILLFSWDKEDILKKCQENHPKNGPEWQSQGILTVFLEVTAIFLKYSREKIYPGTIFFVAGVRNLNFCMQSYILGMFRDKIEKYINNPKIGIYRRGRLYCPPPPPV